MYRLVLLLLCLLPSACFAQSLSWEEQMVDAVNDYRLAAGVPPLVLDDRLSESGRMWGQALKGTGLANHGWYVNSSGYLIAGPGGTKPLSRVWLPSDQGWSDFNIRARYLGIPAVWQSENGYFGRSTDPVRITAAWATSPGHYMNMTQPLFTHIGVSKSPWGGGSSSVWAEFAQMRK